MTGSRGQRVLVLDGQTTQALACVRSLGRAGHVALVASVRARPLAGWSRYCAARHRLAAETPAAFARLRDWARERGATAVLPGTERACLLLNAERRAWEAAGIRVGCAPDDVLQQAFDKRRTFDIATACGVRIPPTRAPESLDAAYAAAAELGYPCVLKSRFSNAWTGSGFIPDRGTTYVKHPDDLAAAVLARRQGDWWPLIQGFVPGRGAGVFALGHAGRGVAWFAHQRLRDVRPSGSGSSLRRSAPLDPRLVAPAERLLAAMRWEGPAMIEFRDDGGDPCLMEVNGRFWGSLQLAVSAGVDFPRLWLAALAGERPAVPPDYRVGVTLRWLWGDVKRLLYILAGPPPGYPGTYPTRWQGVRELFARQPRGTRLEAWDPADPWPAAGEWVQGIGELLMRPRAAASARPPDPDDGAPAAVDESQIVHQES